MYIFYVTVPALFISDPGTNAQTAVRCYSLYIWLYRPHAAVPSEATTSYQFISESDDTIIDSISKGFVWEY